MKSEAFRWKACLSGGRVRVTSKHLIDTFLRELQAKRLFITAGACVLRSKMLFLASWHESFSPRYTRNRCFRVLFSTKFLVCKKAVPGVVGCLSHLSPSLWVAQIRNYSVNQWDLSNMMFDLSSCFLFGGHTPYTDNRRQVRCSFGRRVGPQRRMRKAQLEVT